MGITVYAYEVQPGTSQPTGFGSSPDHVVRELRHVRAEISLDEGSEVPPSSVIAFDMIQPNLDHLFAVLNGDATLCDLILHNKRVVQIVL